MKKIIFLIAIFGCLLFCGCSTTADIEYGIDNDNNAYMCVRINVNAEGVSTLGKSNDIQSTLRRLENYYRSELEFKTEYDFFSENENIAYLTLIKTIPADSYAEAFANLKKMLCDDSISVFSEVSCEVSDTKDEYVYRISGRVDINKVIEKAYDSELSKNAHDYTQELISQFNPRVTLYMPENTQSYQISLTESTEISYNGKVFCADGKPITLAEAKHRNTAIEKNLMLFALISALSLIGIIVGIIFIKKSKRSRKSMPDMTTEQIPICPMYTDKVNESENNDN